MQFETSILLFPALVVGASLHIFLIVLLARKRNASLADRLVLAVLASSGLWQIVRAVPLVGRLDSDAMWPMAATWVHTAFVGLALTPPFLFHLGLVWLSATGWLALPGYLAAPAMWWLLENGYSQVYAALLCASLTVATVACLYRARGAVEEHERRFFRMMAAALLAMPAAGALTRADPAAIAWASVLPSAILAYFIYRYNVLSLLISKRILFALKLGGVFAVYLYVVQRVLGFIASGKSLIVDVLNLILILAAGLVWLPLYGWMTRFFAKRTQIYTDFSRRLVEEAARILDLGARLEFIAREVGRIFSLRKVLLVQSGDPTVRGEFGTLAQVTDPEALKQAVSLAGISRQDTIHRDQTRDPELRALLTRLGFNYLFPLWYEGRLSGLLFLDSSPHVFLDENEPILTGLSDQISLSIATCRAIEEKINMERTLARQEHLASLGKVAATIAHEIKNPLSSIKTLAQLMQEDAEVGTRYGRDLNYMIGETDRLNRSLQQLLSFSRPLPEQRSDLDLSELLESMVQFLSPQCHLERVDFKSYIARGLRLNRVSPEAIKQIVLNLVLNAVQATEAGGTVRLEAGAADGQVVITVSDCGHGIPAELREKVFEPFFTTKQKGTGLGLAIVRKNVRQLGGEIQLESPILEGRGTRVAVTFPTL